MNRPFFSLSLLMALSIPAGHTSAEDDPRPDQKTANSSNDGVVDSFYQDVDIQRFPKFFVQGVGINQQIRCRITSKFEVQRSDEDGKRTAKQVITDTKLIEADPLSQAVFRQSLASMVGKTYFFEIDRFSKVISMKGHEDNVVAVDVQKPDSKGVLISNVIDEDGWKELAELTLFQPPELSRSTRSRRSFVRKTEHDWGSLGSWYGKTTFTGRPHGRGAKRFAFQHELEYRIPAIGGDAGNMLPFEVSQAQFKMYEGAGEILYDTREKRVKQATEIFHARGMIAAKMLGMPSTVTLDERQIFTITVTASKKLRLPESLRRDGNRTTDQP